MKHSCGAETHVIDSRLTPENFIRRRRRCLRCGERFTTYETPSTPREDARFRDSVRGLLDVLRRFLGDDATPAV